MDQQLLDKIIKQVTDELASGSGEVQTPAQIPAGAASSLTEFVGTAIGDTIGLVIANVDPSLTSLMNLDKYKSIGIIGDRVGAGPQIMAVDDAVKATNTEIISVELPRDTKGGAGYKLLIVRQLKPEPEGKMIPAHSGSEFVVAVDLVGAGTGELVLYTSGSSARNASTDSPDSPVDDAIVGIEIGRANV
jgi:microcompartment protein CcmK/EutM